MLASKDRHRDQRQQRIKRGTCMKKSHLFNLFNSLQYTEVATWPAPDKLENTEDMQLQLELKK